MICSVGQGVRHAATLGERMKRLIAIIFMAALTACFPAISRNSNEPETTLKVQNDSFADMTLYAIRGLQTVRLGIANGMKVTILRIPGSLIAGPTPLRFQARPIAGSRQPVTEEITVEAGDEVMMIIPPG
jgi:hypothetical protein